MISSSPGIIHPPEMVREFYDNTHPLPADHQVQAWQHTCLSLHDNTFYLITRYRHGNTSVSHFMTTPLTSSPGTGMITHLSLTS